MLVRGSRTQNPKEYWETQAQKLIKLDPSLALELKEYRFIRPSGASILYGAQLAERVIKVVGNEHGYAKSTITRSMRAALIDIAHANRTNIYKATKTMETTSEKK